MDDKKALLHDSAMALFSTKGFRDTSVADITREAGVAVGTFYLYYASKEKLFLELFLEENARLKRDILSRLATDEEPLAVIRTMAELNQKGMRENPILREWYNRAVFGRIEQAYREENGIDAVDFVYDHFLTLVRRWQQEGRMRRDLDGRMIMALFHAILIAETHKEEIGLEFFPDLADILTQFVIQGLTAGCGNAPPEAQGPGKPRQTSTNGKGTHHATG
ncbi:MAG: TetR/AcrR family transcriptional regulator [Clostridiales bacterium]|nr:TetR/AcrR family transcriptional regulator [Clostridiales bacterium]